MARYERESSGSEPEDPHYFLGMIGVAPGHQGSGHGRKLLDHIHAMSEADPISTGVGLSTEDPANIPYYERAGYRVMAEVDVGEIHSWCMFRPNRSSGTPR
jgi:ribosomal protein S18 acetylase RimI-like enzyme